MPFDGYYALGGTEIINAARTESYADAFMPNSALKPCVDCGDLREALGDEPYVSPVVDDAPWYDPNQPESADFYGFYPLEVDGLSSSSRSANIIESVGDGGSISGFRYATKSARFRGVLMARTELALEYGANWLNSALASSTCGTHGTTCGGSELCFYAACPDLDVEPEEVWERYMHDVSCVEGPIALRDYADDGCDGQMREVSFVLQAGIPNAFAATNEIIPPTSVDTLPTMTWRAVDCANDFEPIPVFANPSVETNLTGITATIPAGGTVNLTREVLGPPPPPVGGFRAFDGSSVARYTVGTPSGTVGGSITNVTQAGALVAGRAYVFNLVVRLRDGSPQTVHLYVRFLDVNGIEIDSYVSSDTTITSSLGAPWFLLTSGSGGLVIPAGTVTAEVAVRVTVATGRLWLATQRMEADYWTATSAFVPNDSDVILDPACPPPPAPPRPPAIPNSCIEDLDIFRRYWVSIPASAGSNWSDMMPTVRLFSGGNPIRQVRVRVYPNPFNRGLDQAFVRYNRATNPRARFNATNYALHGTGTFTGRLTSGAPDGAQIVRVTTSGAQTALNFGITYGAPTAGIVLSGQDTTIIPSVWVRTSVANRDLRARYLFYTVAGVAIGTFQTFDTIANTGPANTWNRMSSMGSVLGAPIAIPPTAFFMAIQITGDSASWTASGQTLDMTMIVADTGPNLIDYWDGNSGAGGAYYYWLGPEHASASGQQHSPVDDCGFCSEFVVSYMPPRTELVVDSITSQATATIVGDPLQRTMNHLLFGSDGGPISWPELTCGIPYLMAIDVPEALLPDVTLALEMTRREVA